ncbi:molybdenum ABC transporter ATP-binding protein [Nitrospira sp. M1]
MSTLTAQLELRYPSFSLQVALELPLRGVTAVFGPSGCGKTTLLRCLSGLERAPNGVVRLDQTVWQDDKEGIFVPLSLRPVGYVFQEPRLFPHLSVQSNLVYGRKRVPTARHRITVEAIVDLLGLEHLLERWPHKLSGGEQQRVAIGRALLTSPELLLMDEPLSSLDVQRKREILPFIQRLNMDLDIPIIYVSHSLQEILQIATTLIIMKEGRVMSRGPLSEVCTQLDARHFMEGSHMGAVIDTVVEAHDREFGLTTLEFGGRHLFVPHQEKPIGERLRVQILSRDVSIITSPPDFHSSVLNMLEASITDIGTIHADHPFVDIKLDIGVPLLATITRKSLATLHLHPGQRVYAQIKAVSFRQEHEV